MKIWKIEEYNDVTDGELESLLNNLERKRVVVKEIIPITFHHHESRGSYCRRKCYRGSYKIIYAMEDVCDE